MPYPRFGDCLSQSLTQAQRQVMIWFPVPALPAMPPYAPLPVPGAEPETRLRRSAGLKPELA